MGMKRKIAFLLVLTMCISLMPATAFAATTPPSLTKTAAWTDINAGEAEITLNLKGDPITVTGKGADVVVVMDYSGSMGICNNDTFDKEWKGYYYAYVCDDCGAQYYYRPDYCTAQPTVSRWDRAKAALNEALNQIIPDTNSANQVAFVAFDSAVRDGYTKDFTKDKSSITTLVNKLAKPLPDDGKGTNYKEALKKAKEYFDKDSIKTDSKEKYVIFLSDGEPTTAGTGEIQSIKDSVKAKVYTIGLQLDSNANNTLKAYATSDKYHYNVTDASQLTNVFSEIAKKVSSKVIVTDVVNLSVFDVLSVGTPTSGKAELGTDKKTVSWTLDNFVSGANGATLKIKIKLNAANINKYQTFITNESASATYVKTDGTWANLAVSSTSPSNEKPEIARTQFEVKYVADPAAGGTVNPTSEKVFPGSKPVGSTATPNTNYKFNGWYDGATLVTTNSKIEPTTTVAKTYTAKFALKSQYEVKFFTEDGKTQVGDTQKVYEGSKVTPPTAPVKPATVSQTFKFDKWLPMGSDYTANDLNNVTMPMSFKASYTAENKATHTVTFYDGAKVHFTTTVYDGQKVDLPTNPADSETISAKYHFKQWVPQGTYAVASLAAVTVDMTFKAEYTATTKKYNVSFFDDKNAQIGSTQVVTGGSVATVPAAPDKDADAQYTYTFDKWAPIGTSYVMASPLVVTTDMSFKASYKATVKKFDVKFFDENDKQIGTTQSVTYGSIATKETAPDKDPDAQYTYSFDKWVPMGTDYTASDLDKGVTMPMSFKASYKATVKKFDVKFFDEKEKQIGTTQSVTYGSIAVKETAPKKDDTVSHTYAFKEWEPMEKGYTASDLEKGVTQAMSFKAIYTEKERTKWDVTFYADEDATTTFAAVQKVYDGSAASLPQGTPTKAETKSHTFAFGGWIPAEAGYTISDLEKVTRNMGFKPVFEPIEKEKFTVSFYLDEDTLFTTPEAVYDGSAASLPKGTPTKAADQKNTYLFAGWVPMGAEVDYTLEDLSEVTGDMRFIASFEPTPIKYNVSYVAGSNGALYGGNTTIAKEFGDTFGTAPTPNANKGYSFKAWSPALPSVEATVTGNVTYTAIFEAKGGKNNNRDNGTTINEEEVPLGPLNMVDHIAYIQGYDDNTVRPQGYVTREEVAAVFFRLLDPTYRESVRTTDEDFNDVASNRWSVKHIATLSNDKILTGYQDGSFKPGSYITRAELAAVASRFDSLSTAGAISFSDISDSWAKDYILSAATKGWIKGYEDGTFKPNQYITRAEFVTLVNNVLERKVKTENIPADAKQFVDLEKGKWYYEAMQEAINSHKYEKDDNGFETWTELYTPEIEM